MLSEACVLVTLCTVHTSCTPWLGHCSDVNTTGASVFAEPNVISTLTVDEPLMVWMLLLVPYSMLGTEAVTAPIARKL